MATELIKDAENDVTELLKEYDLSEEDRQDLAGRLIGLLTDAFEYIVQNADELTEIARELELDKAQAQEVN